MGRRFFLLSLSFLLFLQSQLQIKAYSLALGKNKNLSLRPVSPYMHICLYIYIKIYEKILFNISGNYFYSSTEREKKIC